MSSSRLTVDTAFCRVQRREHEVARHRGAQAHLDRLLIAHLADEHDVGIVAQRGAQDRRERRARSSGSLAPD